MAIASIILEYLKVMLSMPVMIAVVISVFVGVFKNDIRGLLGRIATIKLPGGAELTTQKERLEDEEAKPKPNPPPESVGDLPQGLTPEQRQHVQAVIHSWVANAYLWEYRYLNFFLARSTQIVLDWLVSLNQPTAYANFDAVWLPAIPNVKERNAIMTALSNHHLIFIDEASMISVTDKGREYHRWRGPLPRSAPPESP